MLKRNSWKTNFSTAFDILKSCNIPSESWSFGGGTVLMLYFSHRYSDALIRVEKPIEIILKKMFYRASTFTARDIFDLAIFLEKHEKDLLSHYEIFKHKLPILCDRVAMQRNFYSSEIAHYPIFISGEIVKKTYSRVEVFLNEAKSRMGIKD